MYAGLSLTRLDLTKQEMILLFVCSEVVESNPCKLETRHTYSDPSPMASVLWLL